MVRGHLLGSSTACLLDRLFDDARHEQLQCFRCSIKKPNVNLRLRGTSRGKGGWNLQIKTGVACATLPTSSSACMIFLILATGNLHCADRFTILSSTCPRWV